MRFHVFSNLLLARKAQQACKDPYGRASTDRLRLACQCSSLLRLVRSPTSACHAQWSPSATLGPPDILRLCRIAVNVP